MFCTMCLKFSIKLSKLGKFGSRMFPSFPQTEKSAKFNEILNCSTMA